MKTKFIFALMLGMLLVLGACNEKQEPNKDIQQNGSLNGHDWVNLGLPSGTLWATCNVGADSPEDFGDYFAWGETTPKSDYNLINYKYVDIDDEGEYDEEYMTKYVHNSDDYGLNGFADNKTVLDAEDDAATANWGSGWRMPLRGEMCELIDNCTSIWATQNGKRGRLFTGSNGNTLFLPAAGYYESAYGDGPSTLYDAGSVGSYWSSTLGDRSYEAYVLDIDSYDADADYDCEFRCNGLSVRPVVR